MALRTVLALALLGISGSAMAAQGGADRKATSSAPALGATQRIADCRKDNTVILPRFDAGVCLVEADGWLLVRAYDVKTGQYWEDLPVNHDILFGVLASEQAKPLWPAIIAFAGEDGSGWRSALRARAATLLAKGRSRPDASLEHYVSGSVVPTLQAADLYFQSGDLTAARRVLREKQLELEARGAPADDDLQFDWVSLWLRLAKIELNAGDFDEAARIFEMVIATPGIQKGFRANALVNYAAYLAEYRRPKDALRILSQAEAAAGPKENWVRGSARQFNWIRACALHQLGDKKGVRNAIAVVKQEAETFRSNGGPVASTESIEMRLAFCMGNDAAVAAMMADGDEYFYNPAWYMVQAASFSFQPGKTDTRRRAAQRLMAGKNPPQVRQLPVSLQPAMNFWVRQPAVLQTVPVPAAVGTKG